MANIFRHKKDSAGWLTEKSGCRIKSRKRRESSLNYDKLEDKNLLAVGIRANDCTPDLVTTQVAPQNVVAGQVFSFNLFTAGATVEDLDAGGNSTGNTVRILLDPDIGTDTPVGASITDDGNFSWTPTTDQIGTHTIVVIAVDSGSPSLADAETFVIDVTADQSNSAPNLSPIPSQIATVGQELLVNVSATDPDTGQTLTFALDPDSPSTASIQQTGNTATVRWTPTANDTSSPVSFGILVTDDGNPPLADNESFFVTVSPADNNAAPVLAVVADRTATVGTQIVVNASATDANPADTLTFSLDTSGNATPSNAIIQRTSNTTAAIRWTPVLADVGSPVAFRVRVTDNASPTATDFKDFSVTVVATASTQLLAESAAFSQTVSQAVELGQTEGTRTIAFDLETAFDSLDAAPANEDVFQVYLVDANDPTETLLDNGKPGTPVFSLAGDKAEYQPGLVQFDGSRVEIDVTSLGTMTTADLRFQLINSDSDDGTKIGIGPVTSTANSEALPSPVLNGTVYPVEPGAELGLEGFTAVDAVEVQIESVRYNESTGAYSAELKVRNNGRAIGRRAAISFADLSAGVTFENATGITMTGDPYVSLVSAIGSGGLEAGATSRPVSIRLSNPNGVRFSLVPTVLSGGANSVPTLGQVNPITAVPGDVMQLQLDGQDADGDTLTYALNSPDLLPGGMLMADGRLMFQPAPGQQGTYEFTVTVSDGVETVSQTSSITVQTDPITSTRFSGTILDTDELALAGLPIEIRDASGAVLLNTTTDANGKFSLESPAAIAADTIVVRGDLAPKNIATDPVYPFIAEKLPLVLSHELYPNAKNVIYRPIYLPALDVAGGTTIDPASDTMVDQEIAPGEMASVFVEAGTLKMADGNGNMVDFAGTLSITEVPSFLTPASLPVNIIADTVVTIQPGEMVFTNPAELTLPNRGNHAPGTIMDLWSINPETGDFDKVGKGEITTDGKSIETTTGGINNSSWHIFSRVPPAAVNPTANPNNENPQCNGCKATAGGTSEVELHSGALRETHNLVGYQSVGETRRLQFYYNSLHADPQPIIRLGYDELRSGENRLLIAELEVRRGNFMYQLPGFQGGYGLDGGEHFWNVPSSGGDIEAALQIDMAQFPTGAYEYTLRSGLFSRTNEGQFSGTSTDFVGQFVINNGINSAFGAGWSLAGQQEIVENPDGSVLLSDGGGTRFQFQPDLENVGQFLPPPADFSLLERLADGTFQRTMPDKMVYRFNNANKLTTATDRTGQTTTWQYDSGGRLEKLVDPAGLETKFAYSDEHISSVTDPAGRVTQLEFDSVGNLVKIVDPDKSVRNFSYDIRHRMTSEINQLGFQEESQYDFAGRVSSALLKDGSKRVFAPAQTQVLLPAISTINPDAAPDAFLASNGANAFFSDENGSVRRLGLDQFGQSIESKDSIGPEREYIRDENNLVVETRSARGFSTQFEYDELGNVVAITDFPSSSQFGEFQPNETLNINGNLFSGSVTGNFFDVAHGEIAVASGKVVTILEITDSGSLVEVLEFERKSDIGNIQQIMSGDFNGDGFDDIAANYRSGGIQLFLSNDGTFMEGVFLRPLQSPEDQQYFGSMVSGDFDGDGNLDFTVIVERYYSDVVGGPLEVETAAQAYFGVGDGSFAAIAFLAPWAPIELGENLHLSSSSITVGDANGDGLDDIVLLRGLPYDFEIDLPIEGLDDIALFEGTSVSGVIETSAIAQSGFGLFDAFGSLSSADLNRDGIDEFIYAEHGAVIFEFQNTRSGDYLDIVSIDSSPTNVDAALPAFINGDEIPDLIYLIEQYSDTNFSFAVSEGIGNGQFADPVVYSTDSTFGLAPVFVGRDGNVPGGNIVTVENGSEEGILLRRWSQQERLEPSVQIYDYESEFSQLVRAYDELGRQTIYEIDPNNGNRLSIQKVVGKADDMVNGETDDLVTRFTYTTLGLVDTTSDPLGRVTDFDYDIAGRLTEVTFAVGTVDEARHRFEYDAAGNQTAAIDENSNRTGFIYDTHNRVLKITEPDPDGTGPLASPITNFSYDSRGNLLATTDSRGNVTTNAFDPMDRLANTSDALGQLTTFAYDMAGNLVAVTNPLGFTARNIYDSRSRLIKTVDPEGGITRFTYNLDDNLVSLTDPVGNVTRFRYDARNRLVQEVDPLGAGIDFVYDAADNLIRKTDRNGRITEFEYDDLDRLVAEMWLSADEETVENSIKYSYDKAGNLLQVDDAFSGLEFTYDHRDRIQTVDNAGSPNVVLTYAYDGVGNVLNVSDVINGNGGATTSYTYDGLNRTISIQQSGPGVSDKLVDFTYSKIGQFDSINRYSDHARTNLVAVTDYEYDELNRLVDLDHTNSANEILAFYDFEYDPSSRITKIVDVDGVSDYSYDNRSQLVAAERAESDARGDETYAYDENGNRVSSHLHGDDYETGEANRLSSDGVYNYEYDGEGNTIKRTEIATGDFRVFKWDHRNRLTRVTDFSAGGIIAQVVGFSYDSFDRRIAKTVDADGTGGGGEISTLFVYDREDVLLDFVDSDGTATSQQPVLDQRYLHGPLIDQVLAQEYNNVQWFLTDHLGTTREIIENPGSIVAHFAYDAFGNLVVSSDSGVSTRFLFTGREYSQELNLYFYRARFFDASTGQFLNEDPIRFAGRDANLSRYVLNNPISFSDPSGESIRKIILTTIAIISTVLGSTGQGELPDMSQMDQRSRVERELELQERTKKGKTEGGDGKKGGGFVILLPGFCQNLDGLLGNGPSQV